MFINGGINMKSYKCPKCSYVYKEEKGDWMSGVKKGTLFEDLPEDFKCPTCGEPKFVFEEE